MSRLVTKLWLIALVVTLTWGVFAFGAVYPWAYRPLLVASGVVGIVGMFRYRIGGSPSGFLVASVAVLFLAVGLQLIPIPVTQLAAISPNAIALLDEQSLAFKTGESTRFPLSIDPARTRFGLQFLAVFITVVFGTAAILRRDSAIKLAGAIVGLGVVVAITGIVMPSGPEEKVYGFWTPYGSASPFGPFVNHNHFAGWMLMVLPLALARLYILVTRGARERKPGLRNLVIWFASEEASRALLMGFAVMIMALSLVMTMSRSGMVSLVVVLLLGGTVTARRQTTFSSRALTVGVLAFVAVGVVFWIGFDRLASRFVQAGGGIPLSGRLEIWADTAKVINAFWLTGTGFNTFGTSMLHYQTAMPYEFVNTAHSDYLQLAAEGGLLLCLPILLVIAVFCWDVRRRLREDVGSIWWIRMGAVAGLVAIAVQSIGEFSLQMPGNALLFSVLCGLALHQDVIEQRHSQDGKQQA